MSLFRTLAPLRSLVVPRPGLATFQRSHRFSSLAEGAEDEEGEFTRKLNQGYFTPSNPTFMTMLTFSENGIIAMLKDDIDREKVRAPPTTHHPPPTTHHPVHATTKYVHVRRVFSQDDDVFATLSRRG
jgi:hypothetical protein